MHPIEKQAVYEHISKRFENRHYIAHMDYCRRCNGHDNDCAYCSGHGWIHTAESIAFGYGVNSGVESMNPFSYSTQASEFFAYKAGRSAAIAANVKRIRSKLGIEQSEQEYISLGSEL